MNLHITIPDPVYVDLIEHIEKRFGQGHPGLKSAIITAALSHYLHPELFPGPYLERKHTLSTENAH